MRELFRRAAEVDCVEVIPPWNRFKVHRAKQENRWSGPGTARLAFIRKSTLRIALHILHLSATLKI
jgi:hypothetical protein